MKRLTLVTMLILCAACGQSPGPAPTSTASQTAPPPTATVSQTAPTPSTTTAAEPAPPPPPPPPKPAKPVQAISPSSPIPLPDWLPADIPLCNDAKILLANRGPQTKTAQLQYTVASDADTVVAFYKELGAQEGWTVAEESGNPPEKKLRLTKESRTIALTISPGAGEVTCTLDVTQ